MDKFGGFIVMDIDPVLVILAFPVFTLIWSIAVFGLLVKLFL